MAFYLSSMSLRGNEIAMVDSGRSDQQSRDRGGETRSPTTNRLQPGAFQAGRSVGAERSESVMVAPDRTITGVSGLGADAPRVLRRTAERTPD